MASFKCDIVTPAEKLLTTEAEMVVVPGVEGEMGFWPVTLPWFPLWPMARFVSRLLAAVPYSASKSKAAMCRLPATR